MGTRSGIGLVDRDANGQVTQVRGIYCHWDGYPEHNGVILESSYRDVGKINALLDLGDLSSLRNEIGQAHDFNDMERDAPQRVNDWTTAYGRDRGEKDTGAMVFTGPDAMTLFRDCFKERWAEYLYLFDRGQWYWCQPDGKRWRSLRRKVAGVKS